MHVCACVSIRPRVSFCKYVLAWVRISFIYTSLDIIHTYLCLHFHCYCFVLLIGLDSMCINMIFQFKPTASRIYTPLAFFFFSLFLEVGTNISTRSFSVRPTLEPRVTPNVGQGGYLKSCLTKLHKNQEKIILGHLESFWKSIFSIGLPSGPP